MLHVFRWVSTVNEWCCPHTTDSCKPPANPQKAAQCWCRYVNWRPSRFILQRSATSLDCFTTKQTHQLSVSYHPGCKYCASCFLLLNAQSNLASYLFHLFAVRMLNSKFLQGVLPDCSYKPSYTIKDFPLLRYQGLQFVRICCADNLFTSLALLFWYLIAVYHYSQKVTGAFFKSFVCSRDKERHASKKRWEAFSIFYGFYVSLLMVSSYAELCYLFEAFKLHPHS